MKTVGEASVFGEVPENESDASAVIRTAPGAPAPPRRALDHRSRGPSATVLERPRPLGLRLVPEVGWDRVMVSRRARRGGAPPCLCHRSRRAGLPRALRVRVTVGLIPPWLLHGWSIEWVLHCQPVVFLAFLLPWALVWSLRIVSAGAGTYAERLIEVWVGVGKQRTYNSYLREDSAGRLADSAAACSGSTTT